ncbi:MAG: PqqD family peptide modification chaperone [Candidatus Promineifilaceae bacterium]
MSKIDLNTTVSFREDIMTSRLLDDEMVMMNIDRGSYYGLEESGTKIWEALEAPIKVNNLIDQLVNHYEGVDRAGCAADTLSFLNEMLQEELVVIHAV